MNIFEAFIKKYGQIIILILGMPCTDKSSIAKELSDDLNIPIININDYLLKNKFIEKKIDNHIFKLYEHPNNYDWDSLNKDINEKKSTGIIIYGNYLNKEKINWDIDFSFFFNMNFSLCKKILLEKKFILNEDSEEKIKIFFDKIFNPLYNSLKEEFKINKFFNIKEETTFESSYDEIFMILMDLISKKLK